MRLPGRLDAIDEADESRPLLDRSSPVVLTGWGVELGFCGLTGFGY